MKLNTDCASRNHLEIKVSSCILTAWLKQLLPWLYFMSVVFSQLVKITSSALPTGFTLCLF